MKLYIITTGALATFQDAGQYDWLHNGVPVGGAADIYSFRQVNKLMGNRPDAIAIETAGAGFKALTEQEGWCGFAGAGGSWWVDEQPLESNRVYFIPAGKVLKNTGSNAGNYSYLGVAGGFKGRRSGILQKGDLLESAQQIPDTGNSVFTRFKTLENGIKSSPFFTIPLTPVVKNGNRIVRVMRGAEAGGWGSEQTALFYSTTFTVSVQSNRMGIRLQGIALSCPAAGTMLSTGVSPGTIQIPPDGLPIVLMADAQTTGGYPRMAQVAEVDIPLMAQMVPGTRLNFEEISLAAAEDALWISD